MAIGSVGNYLKKLKLIKLDEGKVRFYRGQSQTDWDLKPSILRDDFKDLNIKESDLIKELHIHYPDSFLGCENLFEQLVVAQHYGIPTRLLDITTNPLVALYFAITDKEKNSGNAVVHVIDVPTNGIVYYDNKKMLDALKTSVEGGKENNELPYPIMCVKARLNNPRIIRQSGAFLFFSNKPVNNYGIINNKQTIEISKSHINQLQDQLGELGINQQNLFPELSQYAECLKKGK